MRLPIFAAEHTKPQAATEHEARASLQPRGEFGITGAKDRVCRDRLLGACARARRGPLPEGGRGRSAALQDAALRGLLFLESLPLTLLWILCLQPLAFRRQRRQRIKASENSRHVKSPSPALRERVAEA